MSAATLRDLRREAVAALRAVRNETAELDVRILLQHALKMDEAALACTPDMLISEEQAAVLRHLVERRGTGEPIARILGSKEFWSRRFKLGRETLVPRPETETLIEAALEIFPEPDAKLRLLDFGTGSGILLAAILLERKNAAGIGTDRSLAALRLARENLHALGIGHRACFVCGDWGAALSGSFDLIVSNPPYIQSGEIEVLPREVREHDPRLALDGGADGLNAYRSVIAELPHLLSPQGAAILELGIGQEAAVKELAQAKDLRVEGPARRDLAGVPRALILYPRI